MGQSFLPSRQKLSEMVCHLEDAQFAESFPAIYQLLCHARDREGVYRAGATLSFFTDTGNLKASVYDRATQMIWFFTLASYRDCWEQVEAALKEGRGEWRAKKAR